MFEGLFTALRDEGVPVALYEWLMLHQALEQDLHRSTPSGFYLMSRAVLVKDEAHYDGFDLALTRNLAGTSAAEAGQLKVQTAPTRTKATAPPAQDPAIPAPPPATLPTAFRPPCP